MQTVPIRALTGAELVALWEAARGQHPFHRALCMLASCPSAGTPDGGAKPVGDGCDGDPVKALAALDIGERNRRLMELCVATFGPLLECEASCPDCGEPVEATLDLNRVLEARPSEQRQFQTSIAGHEVLFRLPNTADIVAMARCATAADARRRFFEGCIVRCDRSGEAVATEAVPAEVLEHVGEEMKQCDPHAELLARLTCPECGARWRVMLDVAELLWVRVAARARGILQSVHLLARAYAWSETDILALSETRRAHYLAMIDT